MKDRQRIVYDRLCAVRAFVAQYFDALTVLLGPEMLDVIDELIDRYDIIDQAEKANVAAVCRADRDAAYDELIELRIKPVLSAARASREKANFRRFRRLSKKFTGWRLRSYASSLYNNANAKIETLRRYGINEAFFEAYLAAIARYSTAHAQAEFETAREPQFTDAAEKFESDATALIAHLHTMIAPHIRKTPQRISSWEEARRLPSHHASGPRRLRGRAKPTGLLPSGPPEEKIEPDTIQPPLES